MYINKSMTRKSVSIYTEWTFNHIRLILTVFSICSLRIPPTFLFSSDAKQKGVNQQITQ